MNCIYCVVDLHAITVFQNPNELKKNILETTASFLATGLNPSKSIIFNQSSVSGHSELAWILNCVSRIGWLNRMTQFKDKAGSDKEKASVGLFIYPNLMAADILLYKATASLGGNNNPLIPSSIISLQPIMFDELQALPLHWLPLPIGQIPLDNWEKQKGPLRL